ncbi:class I adenylate-forming enzyme family protein [Sphingomonas adhaesiva]|uniref:class I adenylate-forming enzyme family protein n=1 Tax=Sphingomonas adhaesiva TaxID=28212 RepID=UPI002FF9605D
MAATLIDLLASAVAADPDAPAILYRDQCLTFADLDRRSARFAGALRGAGIAPGERMFLCLQNVPEFVVALLGAARAGVVTVPLNPMYRAAEIEKLAADCTPRAIVCEVGHAEGVLPDLHRFTVGEGGTFDTDGAAGADTPADPLMLVYTSGTTGKPKGAVIEHRHLLAGAAFYREAAALRPGAPILGAAPLFHVTGISGHIGAALAARAPLILCHRFQPEVVLDAIERHRPVFTVAAITALSALIDAPAFAPARVASLTTIFSGGAPVAPAMRERVRAATGVTLRNVYGLTETVAPVTACPPEPLAPVDAGTGALSVGQAVAGVRLRVVDDDGRDCAAGEPGEIVVSGPSVVAGYWQAPDATAESMRPDGFRTGDVGVLDDDGWLFLVDRKKDMIVASGFKVWPREVEDVLYTHPAVREAAVIGVPDDYRGETVKAVVSLRAGATLTGDELVAFCRERLAAYKAPRIVRIMDALPTTATGKILRRALRD